jgi:hypothetical protein
MQMRRTFLTTVIDGDPSFPVGNPCVLDAMRSSAGPPLSLGIPLLCNVGLARGSRFGLCPRCQFVGVVLLCLGVAYHDHPSLSEGGLRIPV